MNSPPISTREAELGSMQCSERHLPFARRGRCRCLRNQATVAAEHAERESEANAAGSHPLPRLARGSFRLRRKLEAEIRDAAGGFSFSLEIGEPRLMVSLSRSGDRPGRSRRSVERTPQTDRRSSDLGSRWMRGVARLQILSGCDPRPADDDERHCIESGRATPSFRMHYRFRERWLDVRLSGRCARILALSRTRSPRQAKVGASYQTVNAVSAYGEKAIRGRLPPPGPDVV